MTHETGEGAKKMGESSATRVVQLTPEGRGAVAVLLVSGPKAAEQVGRHFLGHGDRPLAARPLNRVFHGHWGGPNGEDVVVCRTAETQIEIHCHGGRAAIERIRADLAAAGCESLVWTDWLREHGPSRIRADAAALLAKATTERTAAILLDQYDGALDRSLANIDRDLAAGRIREAAAALDDILARSPIGLHLVEPWRVVLAGPPNVGKSSLINALVGYSRSIVFDQPGTTRDVVTAQTALEGWPIELSDTAGLRASDEPLEQAGIALARRKIIAADCLVLVFDATQPTPADLQAFIGEFADSIAVVNKIDLASTDEFRSLMAPDFNRPPLATSA
ncbi:MAG TPA: GTPase, partial [Pirellulales bacterium]